jgi:hypothetical protein
VIVWLLATAFAADSPGLPRWTGRSGPHGAPDGCPACHDRADEGDEGAEGVGAHRPATPTCLGCHPTADMHPVGVRAVTTAIPAGWPLEGGAVTCATCHVEPAHEGIDPELPRPWHREGPYPTTLALCARCHTLTEYVRVDPHHAASSVPRADGGCAACHTGMPAQGASAAESRLRTAPDRLCALCHEGPVHHGVSSHVGAAVPAEVAWPSWPEGRIACVTCHDVHGGVDGFHSRSPLAGELRALAGIGAAPSAPGHPTLLVAPLDGLCSACHGVGP